MIPATFDYVRARSLSAALKAVATEDGTRVIAGGQTLLPLLRFRLTEVAKLVDIGHLERLKGIRSARGGVRIGAATTYREVLESDLIREKFPLVVEATEGIADRQVRNMGTMGGSLAHADPASDLAAVMLALDASFTLQSVGGKRSVAARDFFKGPFTTAMKPDELLTEIHLPTRRGRAGMAYISFEQQASGYAIVGAAAVITLARRTVKEAALAFTGVADTPFLADASALVDTKAEPEVVERVAVAVTSGVEAMEDIHASATYRRHLCVVAAKRAIRTAVDRAG